MPIFLYVFSFDKKKSEIKKIKKEDYNEIKKKERETKNGEERRGDVPTTWKGKKKKEVHLCRMKGGKEKKRKGDTTFPNSILDVNGRDHWWWF